MPGFAARIVGLNFFPPSSDARGDYWNTSTDGGVLMANALAHVMTPPGPIEARVRSYKRKQGSRTGGNTNSLRESDNNTLDFESARAGARYRTKTVIALSGACPDVSTLDLMVETGASRRGIRTRVQLFDFDAGTWRRLATFNQTRRDSTQSWMNISNPGRFVKDGTGVIKVRITTRRRDRSYNFRIDHVGASVTPGS